MTIFKLLRAADAFTMVNAALGFLAITYISDRKYALAEALLLGAVIADGLDGLVARRFGGGKESLGDYLDIMADYLSFCVAPAILFYQLHFDVAAAPSATLPQDAIVGVAAGLFVLFGLLRLARHVAKSGPQAGRFAGLPTTGAGFFVVLLVALGGVGDIAAAALVALLAVLMVTEIPYPKVRGALAGASGALVAAPALVLLALPQGDAVRNAVLLVALSGASAYAASGVALTLARVPPAPDRQGAEGGAEGAPDNTQEVDPDSGSA